MADILCSDITHACNVLKKNTWRKTIEQLKTITQITQNDKYTDYSF